MLNETDSGKTRFNRCGECKGKAKGGKKKIDFLCCFKNEVIDNYSDTSSCEKFEEVKK